jgi:hypothetical protein
MLPAVHGGAAAVAEWAGADSPAMVRARNGEW